MLLSGVLLLLLSRAAAAAIVPPPTNVKLSCLNLDVVVTWEYSEQGPQTRFLVHIEGSEGEPYQNETTDHRYDLSDYIWASEERYMDNYHVNVTAVEGGNRSKPVSSETFSFNRLKTVKIECELDFPPVDVDEKDSGATVSFVNPLHHYDRLKHAVKTGATTFEFTISSDAGNITESCKAGETICKRNISFPEGVKKCVSLNGSLVHGELRRNVLFTKTHDICATASIELPAIALAIMLFFLFVVISAITFLICKAKAWTMKLPGLPSALEDFEAARNHWDRECPIIDRSPEDGDSLTEDSCCCSSSSSGGELGEGYRGDEDFAEDGEEKERSPYDCPHNLPHNLQVDMGDGDMVTGYSEREGPS
ncbi:interferon gamma receptor 1-like [Perca flavescens]|uniref:interferon gamma receptor 1-like n=1 Tax=Perca flavescens TaxID=8167 RepID=UPI00106DFF2E|nr:interferon gamma receptor 1-like [Perca flavescens]